MNWSDSQRAQLLQIYKDKITQLGEEEFFTRFDEIREEAYRQIGPDLHTHQIKHYPQNLDYVDPVHSSAATLGRLGGRARSEAKTTSSRSNGKKGGRPSAKQLDLEEI